jgi:hypothetical protein
MYSGQYGQAASSPYGQQQQATTGYPQQQATNNPYMSQQQPAMGGYATQQQQPYAVQVCFDSLLHPSCFAYFVSPVLELAPAIIAWRPALSQSLWTLACTQTQYGAQASTQPAYGMQSTYGAGQVQVQVQGQGQGQGGTAYGSAGASSTGYGQTAYSPTASAVCECLVATRGKDRPLPYATTSIMRCHR